MLEDFRTRPRETLAGILDRRRQRDPGFRAPASVRLLESMFLNDSPLRHFFGAVALRVFQVRRTRAQ